MNEVCPLGLSLGLLRELTDDEQQLIVAVEKKGWKVHCQPTPPERQGAEAIVNYLAAYVSGTAIGNSRLLSDDGVNVTFRYKDYRTNEMKTFTLPGVEFVQRFCEHILPPLMLRVRYSGLFATDGREARLEHCRTLLTAAAGDTPLQALSDEPELLVSADEEAEAEAEDEDEGIVPNGCTCRYCHAELEVAGRLKGTPTLELLAAARLILTLLPTMMQWVQTELMEQLRSGAVDLQRLPKPLRKLLGNQWWQSLELDALAALLQHDPRPAELRPDAQAALSGGPHITGIPPPESIEKVRIA